MIWILGIDPSSFGPYSIVHQFIVVWKFCSYRFLENTDEDSNEENTEIDENPSLPIQTDEIDQPVEEPESSPVTPVPNQDEPGFTQGEINQDSSNSSNTTEQTNTSTKTTTTSTTSSTILSTSTEGRDNISYCDTLYWKNYKFD